MISTPEDALLLFEFLGIKVAPVAKPRMTQQDKWKKRPCVLKYRKFCDELIQALKEKDPGFILDMVCGEIEVVSLGVKFRLLLPKSWSQKKKEKMADTPHESTPDISNLYKAVEDALCVDDSQISTILETTKWWSGDVGMDLKIVCRTTN